MTAPIQVRVAGTPDAPALALLLNQIIDEGGKTAIDQHLSPAELDEWFISGRHCLSCVVAGDEHNYLGFQVVERFLDALPAGWADVATFVSGSARGRGVGNTLMTESVRRAREHGVHTLRAVIQPVNTGAVAYYRAMGFSEPAHPAGTGEDRDEQTVTLVRPLTPGA